MLTQAAGAPDETAAPGRAACPLCEGQDSRPLAEVDGRRYLDCESCGLSFAAPEARPSPEEERRQYALHENDPDDPRYRAFLSRLTEPLVGKLADGAEGLDFGCGPGPAIAPMLAEIGIAVRNYDPLFAADPEALARTYDFITCTEVVEHFHSPIAAFEQMDALLRPGGWLGVMTMFRQDGAAFAGWGYVRDPTHVAFYRARTMNWIARRFGWGLETDGARIALFHKPV